MEHTWCIHSLGNPLNETIHMIIANKLRSSHAFPFKKLYYLDTNLAINQHCNYNINYSIEKALP